MVNELKSAFIEERLMTKVSSVKGESRFKIYPAKDDIDLVKSINYCKPDSKDTYTVAVDAGVFVLNALYNKADFTEGALELLGHSINMNVEGLYEDKIATLNNLFIESNLKRYQKVAALFGIDSLTKGVGSVIIADEQGLGKSLEAIYLAIYLKNNNLIKNVLVVCPLDVCTEWAIMIERFTNESYSVITKSLSRSFFNIINYDGLRSSVASYVPQADLLICDEFHNIKSYSAQRTKAVLGRHFKYKVFLSGTPMTRAIDDLWTVLNSISPKEFGSYGNFISRYCVVRTFADRFGREYTKIVGTKNEAELRYLISKFSIRREKDEIGIDLPPVTRQVIHAKLLPKQKTVYDKYRRQVMAMIDNKNVKPLDLRLRFLRLKQICETPYNVKEKDISGKLDLLEDLVENRIPEGRKVVIVSQYRGTVKCIYDRIKKYGKAVFVDGSVSKPEVMKRREQFYKDPSIKFYVGTISKNAEGLNSLVVADYLINVGRDVSQKKNEQMEARLNRIGQVNPVTIIDIVVDDTVEEALWEILKHKKMDFDKIFSSGIKDQDKVDYISSLLGEMKQRKARGKPLAAPRTKAKRKEVSKMPKGHLVTFD